MVDTDGVHCELDGMTEHFDVIVLGSGISGLTLAHDFVSEGLRVCLIDEYGEPGGNHKSENIGDMSFDIGAIFFWSDYPQFKMFPALENEVVPAKWSLQRVTPDARVAKYPFDVRSDLLARSKSEVASILVGLIKARIKGLKRENARTFLEFYLGPKLMQTSGILNYVKRFYGLPAQEIGYEFAESRMRPIVAAATVKGVIGRQWKQLFRRRIRGSGHCVARPKAGFGAYYDKAVDSLKENGVKALFGVRIEGIEKSNRGMRVQTNGEAYEANRIVSTMPLAHTAGLARVDASSAPRSKGLCSLFCRFRGHRGFGSLILYNFHESGRWKRLTMHSDYYEPADGWEYMSVEVTADSPEDDADELFEDFRSTTESFGLFKGSMELVGSRYTDFAYPVHDHHSAELRDKLTADVMEKGIELAGRQGTFQYFPTSAETIKHVRAGSTIVAAE